ncbi:MAG: hypothetical protein IT379_39875 [Deltaproteobacteria bacterium]|nr:hypothetical protein [Deltaproteobacteria bacterium]
MNDTMWARAASIAVLGAWMVGASACGDDDGGPGGAAACDAAALTARLEAARAGDTVEVGACRIEGAFRLPAGVALVGAGSGVTTLVGGSTAGGVVIRARAGTPATRIEGLAVEHASGWGIVGTDAGSLEVHDVAVRSTRGAGIGVEGLDALVLDRVTVAGPVTEANRMELGLDYDASTTATHGVVVLSSSGVSFDDVSVTGFARRAVELSGSEVTWRGGGASATMELGVLVHGGSVALEGVSIADVLGPFDGSTSFALATGEATVTTNGITVERSAGFGILHAGGSASHADVVSAGNFNMGLLAQELDALVVEGEGSMLRGNDAAGIATIDTIDVRIEGATIDATRRARRTVGEWESGNVGDGIEIVGPATATIRRARLTGNERAGIVLDLGALSTDAVSLSDVEVTAEGTALGVVAQDAVIASGWDSGVTRIGAAAANDAAFEGGLDVIGIVGPFDRPRENGSLGAIVGPFD